MKRVCRYGLLLLTVFTTAEIKAQLFYKSATFKVLDAKKVIYYPGVQGAPITTSVTFTLVMKTCARLSIDSFWMDGKSDRVEVRYKSGETWDQKPMQGDTLLVTCNYIELREQEPGPNRPAFSGSRETDTPLKHKGKLLFRYSLKNKPYYFSITEIVKGENVFAP